MLVSIKLFVFNFFCSIPEAEVTIHVTSSKSCVQSQQNIMTLQGLIEKMTFEVNPQKDMEMLSKIIGNRNVKKHVLQRLIFFGLVLFLWTWLNGGMFIVGGVKFCQNVPKF